MVLYDTFPVTKLTSTRLLSSSSLINCTEGELTVNDN